MVSVDTTIHFDTPCMNLFELGVEIKKKKIRPITKKSRNGAVESVDVFSLTYEAEGNKLDPYNTVLWHNLCFLSLPLLVEQVEKVHVASAANYSLPDKI